jgi:serine/alanine adding enzyme
LLASATMTRAQQPTRIADDDPARSGGRAHVAVGGRGPSMQGFRVVRTLEEGRWAAFVERHPDASIFHTPEMHRVFAAARGHRPTVMASLDDAGEVRALMTAVSIAMVGGPIRSLTTRNVVFAAPLVEGDAAALRALLSSYRRDAPRGLFTEVRHVADPSWSIEMLAGSGFRHEPHLNYLIDLTIAEDELWRNVASNARRNVQKARRLGVSIEEVDGPSGIDEAYPVLAEVYHRIKVPLPDRSLFDAASRILGPLGRFRVLLARHDGGTIGALTLLIYQGVMTYWYTGTRHDFWSHRPGDLLVAHALEAGRTLGCRAFDFGGAGRPDEPYGVRDFKAKYGGALVDFGRDVWVPSPVRFRVATTGYELLRRFL